MKNSSIFKTLCALDNNPQNITSKGNIFLVQPKALHIQYSGLSTDNF